MSLVPVRFAALPVSSSLTSVLSRLPRGDKLGVLARPGYLNYVFAMVLGATGWWVAKIAQDWLMLKLTGDVTWVGLAASLQFAPILVFGLYGGVLADKFNVRHLLLVAQAGNLLVSVGLGILALSGIIAPWHILVAASLTGLLQVVEQPARASMIAQLSGPDINQALSFNSLAFQSAGFWGPALSALVVATLGPGPAFWANSLGCLCTIALVFGVPTADPDKTTSAKQVSLRAGLAGIRNTTEIGWTMVLTAIFALLALNMPLIYAQMANTTFAAGVSGYSMLCSMAAVGSVLGSLVAAKRKGKMRLRLLTGLMIAVGVLMLGASQAPSLVVFGVLMATLAATALVFQLNANAVVQLSAEPAARGRVMGLYILIVFGGMSLAGPLVGRLVTAIGARSTLIVLGSALVGLATVAAVCIGRFSGQTITVSQGIRIVEPSIPRHVRLAEEALRQATRTRAEAEAHIASGERMVIDLAA